MTEESSLFLTSALGGGFPETEAAKGGMIKISALLRNVCGQYAHETQMSTDIHRVPKFLACRQAVLMQIPFLLKKIFFLSRTGA